MLRLKRIRRGTAEWCMVGLSMVALGACLALAFIVGFTQEVPR